MRITFVLPYLVLNGGNLVVAIYAKGLAARGHEVTVVAQAYPRPSFRDILRSIGRHHHFPVKPATITGQFSDVEVRLTTAAEISRGTALPEADILVATWWETMEWVNLVGPEKGKKIHFVQGHEVFDYLPQDRTRAVLHLPTPKLVVSEWLATLLRDEYHATDIHLIQNAVDLARFRSPPRDKNEIPTFGFLYSSSPMKNTDLIIASLNKIRKEIRGVKAISFGVEMNLPEDWIEYHSRPSQELIPQLYANCDAWLFTSTSEGFGLPILEAMASRTPVIATPSGAAPQLVNDRNGQIVDFSMESVMTAMKRIVGMTNTDWRKLSNNAYKQASKNAWPEAIDKMERVFSTYVN